MPELPEVQTVVNHIKRDLIGEKLRSITSLWDKVFHNFSPSDIHIELNEKVIIDVYRRAKFIILQFNGRIIAIHLRMTGKLYISSDSGHPKHCTCLLYTSPSPRDS